MVGGSSHNISIILPRNISDVRSDIPELRGDNYKVWKERVLLHLGWMDIDYAIRKDELPSITETSAPEAIALYEKRERSNRLSVMHAEVKGVLDYIMRMRDVAAQLKALEVTMSESFLDKLSINELMTMCVQEEGKLSMEEGEKGHMKKDCIKFKAWLEKKDHHEVLPSDSSDRLIVIHAPQVQSERSS
ncbi:hypothetical protein V2J09_004492 [Rumex salicifolius]